MNTNPLSTVGLMLTLAGLVGTFFNIQLTQWLRDLIALEQKVQLNKYHGTDPQKLAIVECRIEYKKLSNTQTYIMHSLVIGFVLFVLIDGICMIQIAKTDPLFPNINIALWVFLAFFTVVSGWLLLTGWKTADKAQSALDAIV